MRGRRVGLVKPVEHSSGGYIGYSAGSGYVAGTLSKTWIGAFLIGNTGLALAIGFSAVAVTLGSIASLPSVLAGVPLEIFVFLNAVAVSFYSVIKIWAWRIWVWVKFILSSFVTWVMWTIGMWVFERVVDNLPTLSEAIERFV